MEENIATDTELCSSLLSLDQPCIDFLNSTSRRHQWPNTSEMPQRRNVGDYSSQIKFLFNFYKSQILTNFPRMLPVLLHTPLSLHSRLFSKAYLKGIF